MRTEPGVRRRRDPRCRIGCCSCRTAVEGIQQHNRDQHWGEIMHKRPQTLYSDGQTMTLEETRHAVTQGFEGAVAEGEAFHALLYHVSYENSKFALSSSNKKTMAKAASPWLARHPLLRNHSSLTLVLSQS